MASGPKKKSLFAGSALAALAAIFAAETHAQAEAAGVHSIPLELTDVTPHTVANTALVRVADNPAVAQERRWLAAAALSGILASIVGILGANRLLQLLASMGQQLGQAASKAGASTAKAARAAAGATVSVGKKVLGQPARWIFLAGSLTLFVFTGVAVFDIEWQAGLLTGAGITGAAAYGVRRSEQAVRSFMKKMPFVRPKDVSFA